MHLRERDKRTLTVYAPGDAGEERYAWGAARTVRAALYPGASRLREGVWGEEPDGTLALYAEEDVRLGEGVCVEGDRPDYRVVAVEQWNHVRATLARIPEGMDGH